MRFSPRVYLFSPAIITAFLIASGCTHAPKTRMPALTEKVEPREIVTLKSKPNWLLIVGRDVPQDDVECSECKMGINRLYHPHRPPANNFDWKSDGWVIGTGVLEYLAVGPGELKLTIRQNNSTFGYLLKNHDSGRDPLTVRVWSNGRIIYWKGKGEITNFNLGQRIVLPLSEN